MNEMQNLKKETVIIDGASFTSLEEFFEHFHSQALDADWGRNLDAFNDVLRGGFGTPEGGFILVWKNHHLSMERLGHGETQRVLRARLAKCHPSNVSSVQDDIARAERNEGETVFDWLVEIISDHGPGGAEEEDGVELVLQ